jgi:hypothetical protein
VGRRLDRGFVVVDDVVAGVAGVRADFGPGASLASCALLGGGKHDLRGRSRHRADSWIDASVDVRGVPALPSFPDRVRCT